MPTEQLLEDIFVIPEGLPKTFTYDETLPSLPVPSLQHTLQRYIESVQPFVTAEELTNTKRLAREFECGIGKQLHAKLVERAATERNWVEKWWESLAYLAIRQPLIPHCSMMGVHLSYDLKKNLEDGNYIKLAANYMYNLMKMWLLLRQEKLKPSSGADSTHFTMKQFRRLYNTVRVPGDPEDSLVSYFKTESEGPCPSHVIVMCKGRLFRVDAVDATGALITPADWEVQLKTIEDSCLRYEGPGVGILTCDDRSTWAKNRKHLESLTFENRDTFREIDSAVFIGVLDQDEPGTEADIALKSLAGDFKNRWADKSTNLLCFKNGAIGGLSEHTAFDGLISVTAMFYIYLAMQNPLSLAEQRKTQTSLPKEISFHIDQQIKRELQATKTRLEANTKLVIVACEKFSNYGKDVIKVHRIHPDAYCQMALQLAYYRLHHKLAPTYETATTRTFYNGRTETVRSCTNEAAMWVQAMVNSNTTNEVKRDLLRKAVSKHDQLMNEARNNAGCDRHLFGLYCIAAEEGIQIPELYSEPAYTKSGGGGNFVLSTSLTGYTPIAGGVAPMCRDGYGVFYNINPKWLEFSIIVWRESLETSASKFYASIEKSLNEMMSILGPAPVPAKL